MNTVAWFAFFVSSITALFAIGWSVAGWLGVLEDDWFYAFVYRNAMMIAVVYFLIGIGAILFA